MRVFTVVVVIVVSYVLSFRAASAAQCSVWLASAAPTQDFNAYALDFASSQPGSADIHSTLFGEGERDFTVALSGLQFDLAVANGSGPPVYHAKAIYVRFPDGAARLEAATTLVSASTGLGQKPCLQNDAYLPALQHGTTLAGIAAEIFSPNVPSSLAATATAPRPTCDVPYTAAHVEHYGPLVSPTSAVHATGTTIVRVYIDNTGAVTAATVFESSGNPALDSAAIDSAERTQYVPQVFRCADIGGNYLFKAKFTGS